MNTETKRRICREIAERLEPLEFEQDDLDCWHKCPTGGYVSDQRTWWTDFGESTQPRDFFDDPAACMDLLAAMEPTHALHVIRVWEKPECVARGVYRVVFSPWNVNEHRVGENSSNGFMTTVVLAVAKALKIDTTDAADSA